VGVPWANDKRHSADKKHRQMAGNIIGVDISAIITKMAEVSDYMERDRRAKGRSNIMTSA